MHGYQHENYVGEYNERNQKHGEGTLNCPEYVYKGEWFENKRQGKGICQYSSSGKVYDGQWKKDLYHGQGFLINEDLTSYEGSFIKGKKDGKGIVKLQDGTIYYDGSFKDGLFDGIGILTIPRLNYRYEGDFLFGKKSGGGVESFANGSQYKGSFVNGFKHGYGTFARNTGYTYNGEWQFGVKQGYGVEFNNPNPDAVVKEEFKEGFLYEGEFWNGKKNGIGKLMNTIGDFYYGRFIDNNKEGVGFEYMAEEKTFSLFIYEEGKKKEKLDTDFGEEIPGYLNGYHWELERMYKKKFKYKEVLFNDVKIDYYYYFKEENLKDITDLRVQEPRFLALEEMNLKAEFSYEVNEDQTDVVPKRDYNISQFYNRKFDLRLKAVYNTPKVMTGKIFNNQLISFLTDLIRKKEHLKYVINFYSSKNHRFYCFWMYLTNYNLLQKYPIAVNDIVPISIDGLNLFSQLEDTKNIMLPMLEKVWSKYVFINKIEKKLRGRYIDRILLAFLGAPCQKYKISQIPEDNDIEFLKKIVNTRIPAKSDYQLLAKKLNELGKFEEEENEEFDLEFFQGMQDQNQSKEKVREEKIQEILGGYSPYVYAYPRKGSTHKGMVRRNPNELFIVKEIIQVKIKFYIFFKFFSNFSKLNFVYFC